ncbi:MAG TPA: preprotein translocase subunit SecE [Candidatus Cloacimonadota bacterium]|nr:preprotein translocase subunit SecE [Candidatus Cloacimonadota bacterium]
MKFEKITRFFREVRAEMLTVTWPTKADVKEGTVVVIVMSAITAIFLSLVDLGFGQIVKLVFK